MQNLIVSLLLTAVVFVFDLDAQRRPVLSDLELESQVPSEVPNRIAGMAFDGDKIWVSVYYGKGSFATFDRGSKSWSVGINKNRQFMSDRRVGISGSLGAIAFDGKVLWFGGSDGNTFGSLDPATWEVRSIFTVRRRPDVQNSQSYASIVHDGQNLWAAWHMFDYSRPASEVQQLLKIDPVSGSLVSTFPLPEGSRSDGAHGLTFDGQTLWHIKDDRLSSIDMEGHVLMQFKIPGISRPSGLAWDGKLLWIVNFEGKLWSVPLAEVSKAA